MTTTLKILLFLCLFTISIHSQNVADRIVAVVDNEIVLQSELDLQINLEAAQRQLNPNDPALRTKILDAIVNQKLLYAQAELDTIEISDEEVSQQLDYQMNYFIQQYGSRERVEKTYGMSIDRIRREFKEDTRKQMMAEKVKQVKFGAVEVTRLEVENFYGNYKDSLGLIPEKFKIAHIFINPKATDKVKDKAREVARGLLDSIKNGVDFAELAKNFSEDPGSSSSGGDLGTVKRGVFYPEFEAAAYSMKIGEISGLVESPVGFHIIELLDRKGESIHTRHILIKPKSDDDADLQAIELLTELRDSIVNNENNFAYYANKYSDDKESSKFGGELGIFEVSQLDKTLLDQIYKLQQGQVSFPKRLDIDGSTYGFHIIKLIKKTPEHIANLKEDYEDIKRLAEYRKREKLYYKWIDELKEKIYWEIKI